MMTARGCGTRPRTDHRVSGENALDAMARAEGFRVLHIEHPYEKASRVIRMLLRAEPTIWFQRTTLEHKQWRIFRLSASAPPSVSALSAWRSAGVFQPRNLFTHRLKYKYTCDKVVAFRMREGTMVRNGIPAEHIEVITGGIIFPEQLADPVRVSACARAGDWRRTISSSATWRSLRKKGSSMHWMPARTVAQASKLR